MAILDARMLLAGQGVEAPDWLGDAARASALSNLAQTRQLALDNARRAEESQRHIGEALGQVDVTDDFQVRKALTSMPPESRQGFLTYVVEQRKKIADTRKDEAATDETRTKTKAAQYAIVGGIAGTLARQPTRESWQAAKATLQRMGMDPSVLDVPEGIEPGQHFAQIADGAMTRAQQLHVEDQAAGRKLTERGQDITMRGQDMTDARTREMTAAQLAQAKALREQSAAERAATRELTAATLAGTPQEIMVHGVPTLAIYDRKAATFYDANTRKPIREGMGPKGGDLPASVRESMAKNNVTLTKIDNALAALESNPDALGLKNYLPDQLVQRADPEGVDVRAMVADIAGQRIQDRSGAAVTVGEMERLKPYIPNVKDAPEAAKEKLRLLQREYSQLNDELAAGRSVAELMARKPKAEQAAKPDGKPTGGKEFASMPDPAQYAGKRIRVADGPEKGTIYRSDGTRWVRQ